MQFVPVPEALLVKVNHYLRGVLFRGEGSLRTDATIVQAAKEAGLVEWSTASGCLEVTERAWREPRHLKYPPKKINVADLPAVKNIPSDLVAAVWGLVRQIRQGGQCENFSFYVVKAAQTADVIRWDGTRSRFEAPEYIDV